MLAISASCLPLADSPGHQALTVSIVKGKAVEEEDDEELEELRKLQAEMAM